MICGGQNQFICSTSDAAIHERQLSNWIKIIEMAGESISSRHSDFAFLGRYGDRVC